MVHLRAFASCAVLAGLVLAGGGAAFAATHYVAVGGSDSNPGTSSSPFLTIQQGVNSAQPGDTIIVENGIYAYNGPSGAMAVTINSAGTPSAWITLKAQTPGGAVLDCQLLCHSYIAFGGGSAYWIVQGFDISNGLESGIWSNSLGGKNIQILGNVIHNIGNRVDTTPYGITGIYTDTGGSNWVINGNVCHDVGRTSILTGTHDHCIYTHGGGMLISNNVFYNGLNGWFIQTAAGFSGTIANNTFFGPNPYPGKVGQIVLWDVEGAVSVQNNVFYNPIGDAITNVAASFSGPCSIDHNIVFSQTSGGLGLIDSLPAGCAQTNNLLNVDPLLTTPSLPNYNFQLLSGSPAIGAGVALASVPTDFNGVSRAGRADLGAFQYGGAAAPPPPPPPSGCVTSSGGAWQNIPLASQSGVFTATFSAVPGTANMDGVSGLSNGPATAFTSLAAAVRFNNAGLIDARNGGAYAAAASIPYVAGSTYRFSLAVNVPAHTYSAYVTPPGGVQQTIGLNYAFRAEQGAVAALSGFATMADAGSATACGAAIVASAPPMVISAVTAAGITAGAVTVIWTTNNPADSQVVYGPTAAYGSASTPNAALTTSHSVALSGLTAGSVYHYAVKSRDSSGSLATSPDATFTTAAAALPPGCAASSGGSWLNVPLAPQTGFFTAAFDATPGLANMDGVSGLSNGPANAFTSLAAAVRFNNTGMIDARNGGAYAAAASIPYVAGMSYHFSLAVNVIGRTYSAYVTPAGGAQQTIGLNYAFRTEQSSAAALNDFAAMADAGSVTACNSAIAASAPPTVVSAVSATGVGQTAATIVWTTNNPADSQVQYGLTSSYGVTTTPNSAPVTSHGVALGRLSAGTVYHYKVLSRDAAGNLTVSPDGTFTTAASVPPPCATSSNGVWQNVAMPPQTGSFTVTFSAVPGAANMDGLGGLSNGPATGFASLAAAVRFNNTGKIDARNGGAYAAANSIPYSAGATYRFLLLVNLAGHTYSAYVTPPGGAPQTIGLNYAFRTEQASVAVLNNFAGFADSGNVQVCNVVP